MIYTDLTKKALKLCFEAHKDQKDKSGLPYVFHPFHLAEQMTDEATTVVALLHDVVEDTPYSLDDLHKMGFPQEVTDALALMTHNKRVPYMEYVAKIKENPVARAVKLADLRHNSDLSRLNSVTEKDRIRIAKYAQAILMLSDGNIEYYEWLNEAVGDFDLFAAMNQAAYDQVLGQFGNAAKTSYLDGKYFFFLNSKRKVITPMPFLALAFGGMYDELPIGERKPEFNPRWEEYSLEHSVWEHGE